MTTISDPAPSPGPVRERVTAAKVMVGTRHRPDYLFVGIAAASVVTLAFAPWSWPTDAVFADWPDLLWVHAMAQAHQQAGPIAATTNLGWPLGFSPWSHPQLGLLFGLATWAVGLIGLDAIWSVLGAFAVAAVLNACCSLFLFRSLSADPARALAFVAAFACAVSPFVLEKLGHANVASFYVVPLVLGAALRFPRASQGRRRVHVVVCLMVAVIAPAWWVVVAAMLLFCSSAAALIGARWEAARALVFTLAPVGLGLGAQYALAASLAEEGTPASRGPWESNLYGGHLLDLLVGSPLLNRWWGLDEALAPGVSVEPAPLGIVLAAGAILAVSLVASVFPKLCHTVDPARILALLSSSALLLFLLGGLGNLQAGLAVALGGESPARVWSRLSLLIALLGWAWATTMASLWTSPTAIILLRTAAGALAGLALLEVWASSVPTVVAPQSKPEYQVVQFLRAELDPCPVAQLPEDGFPIPKVSPDANFAYRGFLPFVMAPEFKWTYTSLDQFGDNRLMGIPQRLDDSTLEALAERGFCAVLFDKGLADYARSAGIHSASLELSITRRPAFESDRYALYRLSPAEPLRSIRSQHLQQGNGGLTGTLDVMSPRTGRG